MEEILEEYGDVEFENVEDEEAAVISKAQMLSMKIAPLLDNSTTTNTTTTRSQPATETTANRSQPAYGHSSLAVKPNSSSQTVKPSEDLIAPLLQPCQVNAKEVDEGPATTTIGPAMKQSGVQVLRKKRRPSHAQRKKAAKLKKKRLVEEEGDSQPKTLADILEEAGIPMVRESQGEPIVPEQPVDLFPKQHG